MYQLPDQSTAWKVAVIVPCYRVADSIAAVIAAMPPEVETIYCVDDACPDRSGDVVESQCTDPRVKLIRHTVNRGVGGAVKTGYLAAHKDGHDIAVKVDGDGQMDPALIGNFLRPIALGQCDYSKGNRFYRIEDVRQMPALRLFGNSVLSFFSKLSSGYWQLFDPTNGYTALHLGVLDYLALDKIADRYFFETDMLFRLNVARCVVLDVPMAAVYGQEQSSLKVSRILLPFLSGHLRNFCKRIFYNYFLRDFHIASLQLLAGPPLLITGTLVGAYFWWRSIELGKVATAGTVMIPSLMMIVGMQLTLAALSFDMANLPSRALHLSLPRSQPSPAALNHLKLG